MKKLFAALFLAGALLITGCGDNQSANNSNKTNYAALSKQAIQDTTGGLVTDFSVMKFREIQLDEDIVNTDGVVEINSDGIERKFRARFNAHTLKCEYVELNPPFK